MIQAVIFDMDGTMFDTELLWGDINRKLAAKYGIAFDESVRIHMMGKNDRDSLTVMNDYFTMNQSIDDLITVRRAMILDDASLVQLKEGLIELLNLLDEEGIKKGIATASFSEFTTKLLEQFNLTHRFDAVVTGDDIEKSKPDPEIFLKAAALLGVEPADCLVLEDAQNGVEAADNAGMFVFAIPHDASSHHDFSKATKVLTSMLEVNEVLLQSLNV